MRKQGLWKAVLVLAGVLAIGFAVRQVIAFSRAGKATQPAAMVDLICTECGRETIAKLKREMPMTCPSCKKDALVLAGCCRKCKTTLPLLDSMAYLASPQAAMARAAEVLPKCPECGGIMPPKFVVEPEAIRAPLHSTSPH